MSDSVQVTEQIAPPQEATAPAEAPRKNGVLASIQWIAGTVVIAIFAITFALQAFQIPSPSMENTLMVGDYLLVDKVHFAREGFWNKVEPYSAVRRGDIVVFRYPVNPQQHFVKRVVGIPGDHIRLVEKRLFVNGSLIRENYVIHRDSTVNEYRDNFPELRRPEYEVYPKWTRQMQQLVRNGELTVPADSYFVMGDNRDNSEDSRYWGFVPRENIIGRPLLIYWSLRQDDQIDGMEAPKESLGGRLLHFAYVIGHFHQITRWDRTFRLVH